MKGIIQFDLDILLILLFFSTSADFLSELSGQGRHCCCPATGTVGGLEFQVDDLPDYKRLDMQSTLFMQCFKVYQNAFIASHFALKPDQFIVNSSHTTFKYQGSYGPVFLKIRKYTTC